MVKKKDLVLKPFRPLVEMLDELDERTFELAYMTRHLDALGEQARLLTNHVAYHNGQATIEDMHGCEECTEAGRGIGSVILP